MSNILVDAHLDLAYNAVVLERNLLQPLEAIRDQDQNRPDVLRQSGTCMANIPSLLEGRIAIAGASLFVEPANRSQPKEARGYRSPEEAYVRARAQLETYQRWEDEHAAIQIIRSAPDLDTTTQAWAQQVPSLGLFLVMEGADPIRRPEELHEWVEEGLRGVALAWSSGSRYAGGNQQPGPLTPEGRALLSAMADHNLLLDISHLWETAAQEALDRYPGPVAATHANPRRFVDTPRMLSDTMILKLAERQGVIGIVAFNRMLLDAWRPGDPRLPLSRMVEAIDYICQLTGSAEHVGIGSDLDGGFGLESAPAELNSAADLQKLAQGLKERGYDDAAVTAILAGNWLNLMRRVLEGAS